MSTNPLPGTSYTDSGNLDAFGRLRVGLNKTLFESTFQYSLRRALWYQQVSGTGAIAHDDDRSSANLTTSANNDLALLQTKSYIPYEPGKSQLIKMTFVAGNGTAVKELGAFDSRDGVFLRIKEVHKCSFVLRSSVTPGTILNPGAAGVVEYDFPRGEWNVDRLDGYGPSGIILDITKQQILVIDYQFLGVGRIRFGFNISGKTFYCHFIENANLTETAPYMRTGTLPLRYRIQGTASGLDVLQCVCSEVESEGGDEPKTYDFSAYTPADVAIASGVRKHVISIQPKLLYRGIENRMSIILIDINILGGANAVLIETMYNSTVTGGTVTSANELSATEYIVGGTFAVKTATASDCGTIMTQAFYVPSGTGSQKNTTNNVFSTQFPITLSIDGTTPTVFSIVATGVGGAANIRATIGWKEIR